MDVTVTVSQPYHVTGYHGSRYGTSRWTRRDYEADVFGRKIKLTSKSEIQGRIRALAYREIGSDRVRFTFVNVTQVAIREMARKALKSHAGYMAENIEDMWQAYSNAAERLFGLVEGDTTTPEQDEICCQEADREIAEV